MFSKPVRKLLKPTLSRSSSTVVQRESPSLSSCNCTRSNREVTECRAFRKCFSVLVDGITDPGWLAVQLYSRELIGGDVRTEAQKPTIEERVKKVSLLSAVEDQIVASPATKFREFLDVLQNELSLQHLAKRLENTQHELSELCTDATSVQSSLVSQTNFCGSVLQDDVQSLMSTPSSPPLSAYTQTSSQSLFTSSPHPQKSPSNSCPPLPPAKRPRTDVQPQHPLEHNIQQSDSKPDHQTPPQPTTPYSSGGQSSAVDTYASYLKSVYTREKLPMHDKWPQVKSKKFINLALIEKEDITKHEMDKFTRAKICGNINEINRSKRIMCINQIAQLPDGSQPKCILVEGAPGVGKSTLAWKLCHKWGKGKLLQQYQLVVLLRLRDKCVRTANNIFNLFRYHDHQIQQAAVEEIQRTGGKGVLLLFEGYDELPDKWRTEDSIFLDVITGRELPEATVLITSRPWASEFLHRECKRHISQHIEILGFTKDNIQLYLESTTPDDPSLLADLKRYISCYPHIGSLMCIPLNSAIVVEVYRNSRKDETLVPKTMTELYSSLIRSLLLRYLLDHPVHRKKKRWRIRTFSDLPQDVYQQLCELGRIAYEGILNGQQVIFSDLPDDFETLGLMTCSPELYADEGTAVTYNFLHLTVQEYLAAFHLSQQPVEKQMEHFKKYTEVTTQLYSYLRYRQWGIHFQTVLWFLSGVKQFKGYPNELLNTLCVETGKFGDDSACVASCVTLDALHWLFEAWDSDVIAKLLGSSNIQLHKEFDVVTPFDCFVLGYCLSHSNCTWNIGLYNSHIGDEGVEMLVRGTVEEKTHCTGEISMIDLNQNGITSEGVKHLLSLPKQMIKKLKTLSLGDVNSEIDSKSCAMLACLIPHVPHLKILDLSNNLTTGHGVTVPLIESLITNKISLEQLWLTRIVGVEDCQALSELLSSTNLEQLYIGDNSLSPDAVELIFIGLHNNTALEWLDMNGSYFSFQNTISLASVLRTNHTLVDLDLCHCNIDSDGACQLASALITNDTLHTLNLQDNPLGVKGAAAFAEMLLKNKSLKELSLQDDSIGEEGTQKLIDSLTHNTTVEELELPQKYELLFSSSGVDSRVCF